MPAPKVARPVCRRCRRPASVCYCAACPRLETRTRVVILQHPRERDMPIGTARMASLCLPQALLQVGVRWDDSAVLAHALADPERPPILLFPGPGARDILRAPPAGPVTLVVVDGTWSQARSLVRDNPILQRLPRYAFRAPEPSRYRIRREPRPEYVSTIEALMQVLGALEGDPQRFRALLDPLHAMVEAQLARIGEAPRFARRPRKPPRQWHLPEALAERLGDLVCVVAEANAWPYAAGPDSPPDELVQCAAHRVGEGTTFDVVAAPAGPLSPTTPANLELSEQRLRDGVPRARLLAELARFTRPGDILCAWGHFGIDLLRDGGAALPAERLDLRAVARQSTGTKVGGLEAFAATLLRAVPPPLGEGRAGRRLALLVEVVRRWRAGDRGLAAPATAARSS